MKNQLTKKEIKKALLSLNEKLKAKDLRGEICLFGGTTMGLAFNARVSTKNLDAIFKRLKISTERAALQIVESFYDPKLLVPKTQFIRMECLQELNSPESDSKTKTKRCYGKSQEIRKPR